MIARRTLIQAGGAALAGLAMPAIVRATPEPVIIEMRSSEDGGRVGFDPIGILVEPATRIRWIVRESVHTATAYHPANGKSLRIPQNAEPWDSDYLTNPGDIFEITLTAKGTYDYFCAPHEAAGMVGRIIVGEPAGPGAGGFAGQDIPQAAIDGFPDTLAIMENRVIRD